MAEQMKPSGIDWIGDIPESWKAKPLKYLAKCNQDVLLETTAPDYSFRYVDIGSVTYERGITEYQELRFEDSPSRARRRVSVGDTIISTVRTYLKAIAIISDSENVIVSTGFAVYTPDKAIYPQYLYYFCKSEGFVQEIDKNSYGIAYPAINTDLLSRICIVYPCYEEQQVIADFLDKECAQIDSIAADLEKQIALLQQYKKSLITETVTKGLDKSVPMKDSGIEGVGKIPSHWKVNRLKYAAVVKTGPFGTQLSASEYSDEGIPVINVKNIGYGTIIEDDLDYVPDEVSQRLAHHQLQLGDIVFGRKGAVDKHAIITESQIGWVQGSDCIRVRIDGDIESRYLNYLFDTVYFAEYVLLYAVGTTMASINSDILTNSKILVPPITEQRGIADFLDSKCRTLFEIIENKQSQLATLQQHKKSLIYEYVTGKKRVKEVQ